MNRQKIGLSRLLPLVRWLGDHTFAALFGAAYLVLLANLPGSADPAPLGSAFPAVVGAMFVVVGTVGFAAVERAARRRLTFVYFALQLSLGAIVLWLSVGQIGAVLLVLLLCGQSVRALSNGWLVTAGALLVTGIVLVSPPPVDRLDAFQGIVSVLVATFFVIAFAQTALKEERERAALHRANDQLRRSAAQAEELATARERNRLAREIHDGLGHYLTVVNIQIAAARAVLASDQARAEQSLAKAQTVTREALADVRHSVDALRTGPSERRPLAESLATLTAESNAAGVPTALLVKGNPRPLPAPIDLALYHAAQEGLTNVWKHAAASRADLLLDFRDRTTIRLDVVDDGAGTAATDGGYGLLGLSERMQLVGGRVDIRTAPGTGLTLTVEVPG